MTYAVPKSVLENQQKRALASGRPLPCGEGTGAGLTCRAFPTRLYISGWRCAGHQPQPANPVPDPARTAAGLRAAAGISTDSAPLPAAVTTLAPPAPTVTDRFRVFHEQNPHVYARLVELVADEVLRGATRIGVGALFEQLRYAERTETNGDRFALNNTYRADYVRLLIAEQPEWAGLFETRQRRSA